LEQALAIHRQAGDRRFEGVALGNLAGVYHDTGRIEQAEKAYEQALAIDRKVVNRHHEGLHLCGFALCLLTLKRPPQARAAWQQGAAILRELGDSTELECRTAIMREACRDAGVTPLDADSPLGGGRPAESPAP
jgi:tetratricopeptide (TPR) repeat protein